MVEIIHRHHIVPLHAGGDNSPENLIELTIPEHDDAHRILYENHGRWQDRIAWQTLSGQISQAEAIKLAQSLANSGDNNPMRRCHGAKERMINSKKGVKLGPCSSEKKRKISEKAMGNTRGRYSKGTSRGKGVPKTESSNRKRSESHLANYENIERLREQMTFIRTSHKGTIWINNGMKNKRHPKDQPIPETFERGRISYGK